MELKPIDRFLFFGGTFFLFAWFGALAGPGLTAWFSGDDLMNLYGAWTAPAWGLLESRPLGTLWYRAIFAAAGFDPLPFHAAAWCILAVNWALTYCLARRLSERREVAAIATLLVSYNARFANLYFDTGAIYDVLCYCFYLAALLWYVRVRQGGALLGARDLTVFLGLFACALGSKEMAVTLPLAAACYEWLYHPPHGRQGRGAIAAAAIAVAYTAAKSIGPGALAHAPGYRVTLTAAHALANARSYLDHIFYRYDGFTSAGAIALWLGMLAAAILSRSRPLRFAWAFLTFTIAPMLLVDPRGGSAIYICLFGWALYAAWVMVRLTDPLRRFVPGRVKAVAVFLAAAALLWPFHRFEGRFTSQSAMESGERMRSVDQALHRAQPAFRKGSRILFLNDPIRAEVHDLSFLVQLSYEDDSLAVERIRMNPAADLATFDYVLDYAGQRFLVTRRPRTTR